MGVVWIASYPKSGNTWMRFLLANYLAGPIGDSAQVERLIPGIHREEQVVEHLKSRDPLYAKVHLPWGPLFPLKERTDRAVTIVRHPKDVLLSSLNYQRMLLGNDRGFTDEAFARAFIAHGCDPRWRQFGYGTLESHARSWIEAAKSVPVLTMRYEDLKADAIGNLRRVVDFLGLVVDESRLKMATTRSTFDQMRAIEVREKLEGVQSMVFSGPKPRAGWARYFMNAGQSGAKLKKINPALDAACDRRFASLCDLLGYTN